MPATATTPLPLPTHLHYLLTYHRSREDYHREEKTLILRLKAICRRRCLGSKEEGNAMYAVLAKAPDPETAPMFQALALVTAQRRYQEKALEKEAAELPVAPWVHEIPGFSLLSLGQLVAELRPLLLPPLGPETSRDPGDPRFLASITREHQESFAYKRLGLALVNGERQRRVADAKLATEMGYSPRRRAIIWNIANNITKLHGKKAGSRHYEIYVRRKACELERGCKFGHADNRALRYVAKKFVRHFLAEWNAVAAIRGSPIGAAQPAPQQHATEQGRAIVGPPERGHCTGALPTRPV